VIPTELVVTDLIAGSGPVAEAGDTVVVNYVGVRTVDGFEFDSSYDRGQPFPVTVGTGSVIQGWDLGLIGAQAGMRRQLDIPADLAYGDSDRGDIRPGDALTFVIDVVAVEKRPVVTAPPVADDATCAIDGSEPQQQAFTEMQPFCIDVTKSYTAEIVTNFGPITVELLPGTAPQNVNNFVMLARFKYFDGTVCHRVLTDFVVQCGDPQGDGFGGPGYTIPDELPLPGEYQVGSLAMANTGAPDSAGSQFFIITGPDGAALPPQYSLFGQVVGGLDTTVAELNALQNPAGDNGVPPLETITIESVTITES
jgi:cyclophilin family peptidyl-prolyl cis-trans isomerase